MSAIPSTVIDRIASDQALDRRAIACCLDFLSVAEQVNGHVVNQLQADGLSSSKFRILAALAAGASSPSLLAQHLGVRRPSLTGLLDSLQAQGFVVRTPDPHDRRRWQVSLSESGQALVEAAVANQLAVMAAALSGLDLAERSALRKILSHLQDLTIDTEGFDHD